MYHQFSIAETIKTSWHVLKRNFVPLVVYSVISLFINELVDFFNAFIFVGDDRLSFILTTLIQMIIQSYLALSFYKLILTLIDKEYYEFEFKEILPSFRMTFNFIIIAFAYAILIAILLFINLLIERSIAEFDTILLIFRILELCFILFLLLRSIFCICFIVDYDSSPYESLKQSFEITKDNFFKTLAMLFIIIAFMIVVLIPIFIIFILFNLNENSNEYAQKLMFYCWFIFTFPAVQVMIMVTYRKLVYSHIDMDDDVAENGLIMGIKAVFGKLFAKLANRQLNKLRKHAPELQQQTFQKLIAKAKNTAFGKDHHFGEIKTYEDFKKQVPIRDYEQLRPYIERVTNGEENVLWPGKPLYLTKTSGTTSGVKYIPISAESMPGHINSARNALLSYVYETGNAGFLDGKLIFLQGSPVLSEKGGIPTGRLSGIVAHHIPAYLQKNRMPSYAVNCIEDWEQKVDAIVEETIKEDMRLISGIPPWCQMYFDRLADKSGGKKVKDIFPNFKLFVYGGVNYEPYRARIEESVGFAIDSIETYPASEGFIAFQDSQKDKGLLLQVDSGIFYEFIPADEYFNESPARIGLQDVELNKNYALLLNTNAGLWGYSIGDTVKFISKNPYKILVTGRIKHFISAFGEHVIGEEVEYALMSVAKEEGIEIVEFTVAPQVNPPEGELPYHEWFVEFGTEPENLELLGQKVDMALQKKNIYYFDLIEGNILRPLVIRSLKKDTFINYMRSQGKLGGQNKVPRLANDRKIADGLKEYLAPPNPPR